MIAGGEPCSDDRSLLQHADEWDHVAETLTPATKFLRQTCRKVAMQFRLEHETGEKHCMCCLKPVNECCWRRT